MVNINDSEKVIDGENKTTTKIQEKQSLGLRGRQVSKITNSVSELLYGGVCGRGISTGRHTIGNLGLKFKRR